MIAPSVLLIAAESSKAMNQKLLSVVFIGVAGLIVLFIIGVFVFLDDARAKIGAGDVRFAGYFFGRKKFRLGVVLVIADVLFCAIAISFVLSLS